MVYLYINDVVIPACLCSGGLLPFFCSQILEKIQIQHVQKQNSVLSFPHCNEFQIGRDYQIYTNTTKKDFH